MSRQESHTWICVGFSAFSMCVPSSVPQIIAITMVTRWPRLAISVSLTGSGLAGVYRWTGHEWGPRESPPHTHTANSLSYSFNVNILIMSAWKHINAAHLSGGWRTAGHTVMPGNMRRIIQRESLGEKREKKGKGAAFMVKKCWF